VKDVQPLPDRVARVGSTGGFTPIPEKVFNDTTGPPGT
jgi:hypothetical protein